MYSPDDVPRPIGEAHRNGRAEPATDPPAGLPAVGSVASLIDDAAREAADAHDADVPARVAEAPDPTLDQPIDPARPDPVRPFLAELARAMVAIADRERERIAAVVADDAAGHVERVRKRGVAEANELRRIAEEDLRDIEVWAEAEAARIRREADARSDTRRVMLDEHLERHRSIIEAEIAGVDAAVADYREFLDAFFADLAGSTDPAEIAHLAGALPPPPDFAAVRTAARASAIAAAAPGAAANAASVEPAEAGAVEAAEPAVAVDAAEPDVATAVEGDAAAPDSVDEPAPEPDGAAPVGVMDPEVVARIASGASAPSIIDGAGAESGIEGRVDGGDAPDSAPTPAPDDRPAVAHLVGDPVDRGSAAVRFLRSIAPWTSPTATDDEPPRAG